MTLDQTSSNDSRTGPARAHRYWLALSVMLLGLACTGVVWRLIQKNEINRIQRITTLVGAAVSADASADSDGWLRELERFANFGSRGRLAKNEWQELALLYIHHHPGTLCMGLQRPRADDWYVSEGDYSCSGLESSFQEHASTLASITNKPVSIAYKRPDGRDAWITVVPVDENPHTGGSRMSLIASFDLLRSIDSMAEDVKGLGFSISAGHYGSLQNLLSGGRDDEQKFRQSADTDIAGTHWQITVWPKPEALEEMQSSTPVTVLVGGLLLSLMISLTVFFAQTSARRATFLERANQQLQEENRARQRSEEALRASHARFSGILEISPDAVISTDDQQRITLYNRGAENMFGYTAGEVLGRPISMLLPERLRAAHSAHVRRFQASQHQTLIMSEQAQLFGLRKDGTELRLVGSVAKLEIEGEKIFTSMFRDVTESARAAEELRRAHDELEVRVLERTADLEALNAALQAEICERMRAEQSLRELSGRLLRLQDEERRRIARELHDGTIQNLAALALTLNLVRDDAPKSSAMRETLGECLTLIQQSTGDLRTISYLLHPPVLEELGLTRTLQNYVEGFSRRSGIPVTLQVSEQLGHLPSEIELTIFRIVQESLSNIHRHSNSQTAAISLLRVADTLILEIADQGTGIPNLTTSVGVGIAGMRERVRLLGGETEIQSSSAGTTIRVLLGANERAGAPAADPSPTNSATSAA
jgi:PAS domain S-box-containing protein